MGKTLLYRLFGLGRIPRRMRPVLEQEGIVLLEEGIGGSVTFRNFRAPGRRYSLRRSWFSGSLVVTRKRVAAFFFARPIIDLPLDHERAGELNWTVENASLRVQFDASTFHEGWSGSIEYRFSTARARQFMDLLAGDAA